jgi:methylated-DNA-[protein]-cysteine S-methyltransferase
MNLFFSAQLPSPLGDLALAVDEAGALAAIRFSDQAGLITCLGPHHSLQEDSAKTAHAVAELQAYFAGELRTFATPIAPVIGTPFQRQVWATLTRISFGTTWSYQRLAQETGSVARAVGAANGANPISIVVPCHRVIGANGSLTGYAGGLVRKRALLIHEGALIL